MRGPEVTAQKPVKQEGQRCSGFLHEVHSDWKTGDASFTLPSFVKVLP